MAGPVTQTVAGTMTVSAGMRPRRLRGILSRAGVLPAILFLLAVFIIPMVNNVGRSLYPGVRPEAEASLDAYVKLFTDGFYINALVQTVVVSVVVTLACLLVGLPVAVYLTRRRSRLQGVLIFLLIAPLLTSIVMRSFGWRVLLGRAGLVNQYLLSLGLVSMPVNFLQGPAIVIIGLVHVLVPFMVLTIASVLQSIDPRLEESARSLGASNARTFLQVTLPLSLDGIGAGCLIVFMLSMGSFVTILLLGDGSLMTLPLLIYQQFNVLRDFGFAAAMSNILLVVALIVLYFQLRVIRRRGAEF
jgi:putative spermidine/putrescine transport system permease protein